jgi:hypothetical protein
MREGRVRGYKSWMRFALTDNVKINLKYRVHLLICSGRLIFEWMITKGNMYYEKERRK